MSTGSATTTPTAGRQPTHRRRVPELLMSDPVVPTVELPPESPNGYQCNGYLDYVSETTVNCLGCCTATCHHHHHHHNNYFFLRKGSPEKRILMSLRQGKNLGRTLFGFLIVLVVFTVFLKLAYMAGSHMAKAEADGGYNAGMFILRDYKRDSVKAQRVLSDIHSSMPMRVLEKYSKHPVEDIWMKPNSNDYHQCIVRPKNRIKTNSATNGYLLVHANGGLNQMRTGICDMVAIAKIMNATLVLPSLDHQSFWTDPSYFEYAASYHTTIPGEIGSWSLYSWLIALLISKIEMDESNEDLSVINRNKRKSQNEDFNLPVSKHTCLDKSITPSAIQSDIIHSRYNQTEEVSVKDSNSFFEDADSVMSVSNDSGNEQPYLKISPYDYHSTSSVNWGGRFFDTSVNSVYRSETKVCDEVSMNPGYDLYVSQNFEEQQLDCGENETKQVEDEEAMDDFFCSNGVIPDNFVLSSGRWNINQDTQQGVEKMTIDKEFEEYFSTLML